MVTITSTTQPSAFVAGKARNCFVRKVRMDTYIVKPRYHGKTRRRVRFELKNGDVLAECRDYYAPYKECPANEFGNLCHHVWSAFKRLEINSRKQERKAA